VHGGWQQLIFERDAGEPITPVAAGGRRLVVVRGDDALRVFDGSCPHRGAHLGYGGRVDAGAIVCPFHGKRIRLGAGDGGSLCVREHRSIGFGGMLFALLDDTREHGLEELLERIGADHVFVPGFEVMVRAPAQLVIENAFDEAHFRPVHHVVNDPRFEVLPSEHGEHKIAGTFTVPPSPWQRSGAAGSVEAPFVARAFSPSLVISHLGGEHPYWIITCATPADDRSSTVRLSLAVPREGDGSAPEAELCRYLLMQSRAGILKDAEIWEHLDVDAPQRLDERDATVAGFRDFCAGFADMPS
jgi:3-ketosteroid 9alpha-monooxygenase subunit A